MQNKILSLSDLKNIIPNDMYNQILKTHYLGDPDWLTDMISELDYIKPGDKFYIKDFHGIVGIKHNYKSCNFQTDYRLLSSIGHQIDLALNKVDEQIKLNWTSEFNQLSNV